MAKRQKRDLKRDAFWRRALERFGKSGLSVRGFCAREKLSEPSFYHWRRVLQERDEEQRRAGPAFVPVVVHDEPRETDDEQVVIELQGGRLLRLPSALPMRQVAELVHAIEAAPLATGDRS